MKGLSKGLKYISQFFDNDQKEEEEEIQIGAPTDVKHVAHIGNDGPRNNAPSWMNEFNISPETTPAVTTRDGGNKDDGEKADSNPTEKETLSREIGDLQKYKPTYGPARYNSSKTKQSKRQMSNPSEGSQENLEGTRPRRHKSSNMDTSNRDPSERPRRNKNSSSGTDTLFQDPNGVPTKKSNKKKSTSGDSTRSSKSKESSESMNSNFGNMELESEFVSKDNDKEPNRANHEDLSNEVSSEIRDL